MSETNRYEVASKGEKDFLVCSGLSKSFGGRKVLQDINLAIRGRERFAIIGASGAGKTTLLRIICGLEVPSDGKVWLNGRPIADYSRMEAPIGMVFQRPAVYPHMTVRDNLAFPLTVRGRKAKEITERVQNLAELLDLTALLDQQAGLLSGGEAQRVAIGKSLANPPMALLLDEPFGNLHQSLRWKMVDYIRQLHLEFGLTTILVTHEPSDAMFFADRIAVMSRAGILQLGSPENISCCPANVDVARLVFDPSPNILEVNVLVGVSDISGRTFCVGGLSFAIQERESRPVNNGLQMAWKVQDTRIDIGCTANDNFSDTVLMTGTVIDKGFYNNNSLVSVTVHGKLMRALADAGTALAPGDQVTLNVPKSKLHFFDVRTGNRFEPSLPR